MSLPTLVASLQNQKITLVAVTKTFSSDVVKQAYELGVRHFGENRVGEAAQKKLQVKSVVHDAIWHMVGHVQTRKAQEVVRIFDWIDSVDSLKLAERLDQLARGEGKKIHILLEVNVTGETTKFGFRSEEIHSAVQEMKTFKNLILSGLMTMPPKVVNPEENRQVFKNTKKLFDEIRTLPLPSWKYLSMGTSQDWEVAVEEGATMVRLGTILFGEREEKKLVNR